MVLKKIKESERVEAVIEDIAHWTLKGALIIGAFLFLEKILGFGFDLQVYLGL